MTAPNAAPTRTVDRDAAATIALNAARAAARKWGMPARWRELVCGAWRGAEAAAAKGLGDRICYWNAYNGIVDQVRYESDNTSRGPRTAGGRRKPFEQQPEAPRGGELPEAGGNRLTTDRHPDNFPDHRGTPDAPERGFREFLDGLLRAADTDFLVERFVHGTEVQDLAERYGCSRSLIWLRQRTILKRLRHSEALGDHL